MRRAASAEQWARNGTRHVEEQFWRSRVNDMRNRHLVLANDCSTVGHFAQPAQRLRPSIGIAEEI
jgi:hypothetical protein